MSWLQIGCPFCPSEINVPAALADSEVTCEGCGKAYLVPTPQAPVLAAAGPLAPVAILRTPGRAGNTATGMAPIARLPAPVSGETAAPSDAGRSMPLPPKLRRGGVAASGGPYPWEMSPEARASAAAVFGADPELAGDEDELEAVQRRLRKERFRAYARWMMIGLAMIALGAVATFFLRR